MNLKLEQNIIVKILEIEDDDEKKGAFFALTQFITETLSVLQIKV